MLTTSRRVLGCLCLVVLVSCTGRGEPDPAPGPSTGDGVDSGTQPDLVDEVDSGTGPVDEPLPVNRAPSVKADAYVVPAGAALLVPVAEGVLANDSDPDGDPLTARLETNVSHGELRLSADGALSYTPASGFSGDDAFTYSAGDGTVFSLPATVVLHVTPPLATTSLQPERGPTGVEVLVSGEDLGLAGTVKLGDRAVSVLSWSRRAVRFRIPTDFASGAQAVVLTPTGASPLPALSFQVVPSLYEVTPAMVRAGGQVALSGDALGASAGQVSVEGVAVTVASWTNRRVGVRLPQALGLGRHTVSLVTSGGEALPTLAFTVTDEATWANDPLPTVRRLHSAVWTGSRMLVWGGRSASGWQSLHLREGNAYEPGTGRWSRLSHEGAPAGRSEHTAVWTGSEMLVWGGMAEARLGDGGRYEPQTDSWRPMRTQGALSGRTGHTAVWTGSEMLVWGGHDGAFTSDGARYDPSTDTWRPISAVGAPSPRFSHVAVWTGTEMVVWGGFTLSGPLGDGARYDPVTDTWRPLSSTGAPVARDAATAVWTGSRMLVWGGRGPYEVRYASGGEYDPATDTWTAIPEYRDSREAPGSRAYHVAVWTGSEMIIWGGEDYTSARGRVLLNTGGRYDPSRRTWVSFTLLSNPTARKSLSAVWTGSEMVVFGGRGKDLELPDRNDGGRYVPSLYGGQWTLFPAAPTPSPRVGQACAWTGEEFFVWGGSSSDDSSLSTGLLFNGARYHPASGTWRPVSATDAPTQQAAAPLLWTGTQLLHLGAVSDSGFRQSVWHYEPARNVWSRVSTTTGPYSRTAAGAVWTGSEVLLWGGRNVPPVNTGGRYNPATRTWTLMSITGAPIRRSHHSAVWTGTEMVVWGGKGDTASDYFQDGGRYNPTTDTWRPMSLVNAPSPRAWHSAVWTGTELVVWGGSNGRTLLGDGARYNPATDTWTPMSMAGAPTLRMGQVATWTGSEVLIWGGATGSLDTGDYPLETGARYNPVTDTWTPLPTLGGLPARTFPCAQWTGAQWLLFGGSPGGSELGRFIP